MGYRDVEFNVVDPKTVKGDVKGGYTGILWEQLGF